MSDPRTTRYRATDDIRINVQATAWMEQANCVGVDPTVTDAANARLWARKHCTLCPVREECLQFGLKTKANTIVMGGVFFNNDGVPNLRWTDHTIDPRGNH